MVAQGIKLNSVQTVSFWHIQYCIMLTVLVLLCILHLEILINTEQKQKLAAFTCFQQSSTRIGKHLTKQTLLNKLKRNFPWLNISMHYNSLTHEYHWIHYWQWHCKQVFPKWNAHQARSSTQHLSTEQSRSSTDYTYSRSAKTHKAFKASNCSVQACKSHVVQY